MLGLWERKKIMTREQAKANLQSMGIAEPTDEQVSSYLNQLNGEVSRERKKAEQYKADATKAQELQAQLDELNNANLSEIEKANKATEDANTRVADLEKQIKTMTLKTSLAEQGIVGENADKIIEGMASGNFDASILGQIITEREKSAVANFEKEKLKSTPNPEGGTADLNKVSTPEKLVKSMYEGKKQENNILSNYITKER